MLRVLKRLSPFLVLIAVLALALPAAAQQPPISPQPDPVRPDPSLSRVPCVPVGTALAVLAGDATVAKIIGVPLRAADSLAAAKRTITLDGPGAVGACGQFQGFWADGVAGPAVVQLQLLGAANATDNALATDGWRGDHTGPAIENKGLRALTKLEKPGTYEFVAVFSVRAGAGDTSAARLAGVSDAAKIPFTVVVRGKGLITGQVLDTSGSPIQGALVRAMSPRNSITPRSGNFELPVVDPVVLGNGQADPVQLAPMTALTGPDGKYRIPVPTGEYLVTASARGYQVQWYKLKDQAQQADKVKVADMQPAAGIDFALKAAEAPKPPEPRPMGAIQGRVVTITANGDITPVAGATVAAVGNTNVSGSRSTTAVTDEDGNYALKVPAGKWLVMAQAQQFRPQWFKGAETPTDATPVEVTANAATEGIDFELLALPYATISGKVTHIVNGGEEPLAGAMVTAMSRPTAITPGGNPNTRGPVAVTDEDGNYTLQVPPGTWAVGATQRGPTGSAAGTPTVWWDGKEKLEDADLLALVDGDVKADIDFLLK